MRNKRVKMAAWILAAAMFMTAIPAGSVYAEEDSPSVVAEEQLISEKSEDTKESPVSAELEEIEENEIAAALNYLYVNEAEQSLGDEQDIVVSWGDGTEDIKSIELILEDGEGQTQTIYPTVSEDGVFLYQEYFEKGVHSVIGMKVITKAGEKSFTMEELGVSAHFSVGVEASNAGKSEHMELESVPTSSIDTQVVTIDSEGVATAENSISSALEETGAGGRSRLSRAKNDIVVVLDPGHDSKHTGAQGNGIKEEVATLKIANYCKAELETYDGVTVYMTRTSAFCPYPDSTSNLNDIEKRVYWAAEKGANVFVSIHLNSSTSTGVKGAEVYYSKYSTVGKNISQKIQNELIKIGLYDRKIKSEDAYKVVNTSQKCGFPGIIIEHAFLSNKSDADKYLKTEAGLKKLGIADAEGIVNYYGLQKAGTKVEVPTVDQIEIPAMVSVVQVKGSMNVNWAQAANATGYNVYRRTDETEWACIASVSSGSTLSYTDKTAVPGQVNYYAVEASCGSVVSGHSEEGMSAFAMEQPGIKSVTYSNRAVTVNWQIGAGVQEYYVYRKVKGGKWSRIAQLSAETESYTDTNVQEGERYYYTVRAFNGAHSSNHHSGAEIVCLENPGLVSAKYSGGKVTVKWNKVSGAKGYYVYRKVKGGSWKRIANVKSASKLSYTDSGATAGKTCIYTVRAYRGGLRSWYDKNGVSVNVPKMTYQKYKTKTTVNYRTGPGTSYKRAGSLRRNKTVQVVKGYSMKANGSTWYKVKINSKFYYMSSKYLKKI